MIMPVFHEYCIWKHESCYDSLHLFGDETVTAWVVVIFNPVFVFSMIDMVILPLVIFHAMETPIKFVEDHGHSRSTILVRILFNYLESKNHFNACYNSWEMRWVVWHGHRLAESLPLLTNDWILLAYLLIYSAKAHINEFRLYFLYKVSVKASLTLSNSKTRNVQWIVFF